MFELVRPTEDTTIYGYAKEVNAGIDEVVELNTRRSIGGLEEEFDDPKPSRILMKFPEVDGDFAEVAPDGPNAFAQFGFETADRNVSVAPSPAQVGVGGPNAFAFFGEPEAPKRTPNPSSKPEPEGESFGSTGWLRMWFVSGMGMPKRYEIEARRLNQNWREGRGRAENRPPTEEPASWTARLFEKSWQSEGGDFKKRPVAKEIFDGDDPDVNLKLNSLLSSGLEHGILLKRKNENFDRRTELKFFSKDTRTIFIPHLLIGRDTYELDAEGANPIEEENFTAYVAGLENVYHGGAVRFEVTVEEKFKQRQFLGVRPSKRKQSIESSRYLPRRSLRYKIEDVRTGTTFFPFDRRYSAVSFDGHSHYFDVNIDNLPPKREYEIILKHVDPKTGKETIFDNHQTFKVE